MDLGFPHLSVHLSLQIPLTSPLPARIAPTITKPRCTKSRCPRTMCCNLFSIRPRIHVLCACTGNGGGFIGLVILSYVRRDDSALHEGCLPWDLVCDAYLVSDTIT